jgi:hypothetical protein
MYHSVSSSKTCNKGHSIPHLRSIPLNIRMLDLGSGVKMEQIIQRKKCVQEKKEGRGKLEFDDLLGEHVVSFDFKDEPSNFKLW